MDEFKSEWYRNWHVIDADKSNYINFHTYCVILDVIGVIAEGLLRQSNDSLKNHMLFSHILQGPEYEFTTGSRFTRWLKKKLFKSYPPEILRVELDNKYFIDISIDMFIANDIDCDIELTEEIVRPHIKYLIRKLKEDNNDDTRED